MSKSINEMTPEELEKALGSCKNELISEMNRIKNNNPLLSYEEVLEQSLANILNIDVKVKNENMINEPFTYNFEVINTGAERRVFIHENEWKYLRKKGIVLHDFKEDNLYNIFVIPENGLYFDGNILICKINQDEDIDVCTVIYKINIDMFNLIFDKSSITTYLKPIYDDGNKELAIYMYVIFKTQRKYRLTIFNERNEFTEDELIHNNIE